jgi:hypothetical protein
MLFEVLGQVIGAESQKEMPVHYPNQQLCKFDGIVKWDDLK